MRRSQETRRVVVVDDQREGADTLSLLLNLKGAEARSAYDAVAAFQLVVKYQPEAVILDIQMPGIPGDDLARLIRATPSLQGIVLIALTGYQGAPAQRRIEAAGFNHSFVKPVSIDELMAVIGGTRLRARPQSLLDHPPRRQPTPHRSDPALPVSRESARGPTMSCSPR